MFISLLKSSIPDTRGLLFILPPVLLFLVLHVIQFLDFYFNYSSQSACGLSTIFHILQIRKQRISSFVETTVFLLFKSMSYLSNLAHCYLFAPSAGKSGTSPSVGVRGWYPKLAAFPPLPPPSPKPCLRTSPPGDSCGSVKRRNDRV